MPILHFYLPIYHLHPYACALPGRYKCSWISFLFLLPIACSSWLPKQDAKLAIKKSQFVCRSPFVFDSSVKYSLLICSLPNLMCGPMTYSMFPYTWYWWCYPNIPSVYQSQLWGNHVLVHSVSDPTFRIIPQLHSELQTINLPDKYTQTIVSIAIPLMIISKSWRWCYFKIKTKTPMIFYTIENFIWIGCVKLLCSQYMPNRNSNNLKCFSEHGYKLNYIM